MKISNQRNENLRVIEAITDLCFAETPDLLKDTSKKFDACIVCGSNDKRMMETVLEFYLDNRIKENIIVSGHQAPLQLSNVELESYEQLLPFYENFKEHAKQLGIPEKDVEPPFLNKIENTKRTMSIRRFDEPEYQVFMKYGIEIGLPQSSMILEKDATNAKENIEFSLNLLDNLIGLNNIFSIAIVGKAFMMRRCEMVLLGMKNLPNHLEFTFIPYTSPEIGSNTDRQNWHLDEKSTHRIMSELVRIGNYTLKGDLSIK